MTKPSPVPARMTARAPLSQHDLPPLQWWRGASPCDNDVAIITLRTALARVSVLAFPDTHAAMAGDDAVAVRIALHVCTQADAPAWLIDWAGSLLLFCTLKGSLTAAIVLVHLRRRAAVAAAALAHGRAS